MDIRKTDGRSDRPSGRSPEQIIDLKLGRLLEKAGLPKAWAEAANSLAGEAGGAFLKQLRSELLEQRKSGSEGSGAVNENALLSLAESFLSRLVGVNEPPKNLGDLKQVLGPSQQIAQDKASGAHRVVGEIEGHALVPLMKAAGLEDNRFGPAVARTLGDAISGRVRLDAQGWTKVGLAMLDAGYKQPGTIHQRLARAAAEGFKALGNEVLTTPISSSPEGLKQSTTKPEGDLRWNRFNSEPKLTDRADPPPKAEGMVQMKGGLMGLVTARSRENGLRQVGRHATELNAGLAKALGVRDPALVHQMKQVALSIVQKPNLEEAAKAVFASLGVDGEGGGGAVANELHGLLSVIEAAGGDDEAKTSVVATALVERLALGLGAEPGAGASMARSILAEGGLPVPPAEKGEPTNPASPRLIDLSDRPAPKDLQLPPEMLKDEGFLDLMDGLLGPTGLNAKPDEGGNIGAAFLVAQVLFPAVQKARQAQGSEASSSDPKFMENVLRTALEDIKDSSPMAAALLQMLDTISSGEDPTGQLSPQQERQRGVFESMLLGAQVLSGLLDESEAGEDRKAALSAVREALSSLDPKDTEAQKRLETQARALQNPGAESNPSVLSDLLRELEHPPTMVAEHRAVADALETPEQPESQAVLRKHLASAQVFHTVVAEKHGGDSPIAQAQSEQVSVLKGALSGAPSDDKRTEKIAAHREAAKQLSSAPTISPAEWAHEVTGRAKSGLEALDTQAKSLDELARFVGSRGRNSWTKAAATAIWNDAAGAAGGAGGPGDGGGPSRWGGPGKEDAYSASERYITSLGGRNRPPEARRKEREDFDALRAILEDPSLEFFDKMFLFMAMMVNRLRNRVEEDQIEQLDREERMYLNEQLAHEYQKEVEMAHRDIHEFGKKIDAAAETYSKAEDAVKRLERTPEAQRTPEQNDKLTQAKDVREAAKTDWHRKYETFEQRKVVLNELRDSRDMHRTQIASDRRHIDIFGAKVKRNTHLVEMYIDLMKTFEEHRHRNLQRLLN